jgi:hypothetical protein
MVFVLNAVPLNTNPSSAGSNLLTKKKFCQPSLLKGIGERTMAPRTTRAGASKPSNSTHSRLSKTESDNGHTRKKQEDMDSDIYGLPLSSDEDDEKLVVSTSPSPPSEKMARPPKFSPPKPMASRSTKTVTQATFSAVPDLDDLFSSQPKKKRKVDYTTRNIHTMMDDIDVKEKPGFDFVTPAALDFDGAPSPKTAFRAPPPLTGLNRRRGKKGLKEAVFKIPSPEATTVPASTGPTFKMPTMLEDPDSSAPSLTESTFDIPQVLQAESRKRSGSTSSLSSHSSIELRMTLEEERELNYDATGDDLDDKPWEWCNACLRKVERSEMRELCAKYKGTGIRRWQRICAAHQKRKAERLWLKNGYPMIDWQDLEEGRIPRHIPHLNNVLRRNTPSFYLAELDAVVQKGRKALHGYLKDGVIDVAKQGYYGPRGARVLGHIITTSMEAELVTQLKMDKVVREAGFGGYVSAVLVPELMVELVKEDMHVTTSEKAREVLERSTKDGELINGDDDEVVLRAKDDD